MVHRVFATGEGRFWAESVAGVDGTIDFGFPGGPTWRGRVLDNRPPHRFVVEDCGGSITTCELGG